MKALQSHQRQFLSRFNERVERLSKTALSKRMATPNYKLEYERMQCGEWISLNGVSADSVDAFVLNMRLLIQDRDGISIRCLDKNIYSLDEIPKILKDRFIEQISRWEQYRNSGSMFKHFSEDRNFLNGEIFDILLYGGLAHMNQDKVDKFLWLTRQGLYSSLVCASFVDALHLFLGVVTEIRKVNLLLLAEMN